MQEHGSNERPTVPELIFSNCIWLLQVSTLLARLARRLAQLKQKPSTELVSSNLQVACWSEGVPIAPHPHAPTPLNTQWVLVTHRL